jgi:hypothetical protein
MVRKSMGAPTRSPRGAPSRTKRCSCQDKPETMGVGAIPCNGLL